MSRGETGSCPWGTLGVKRTASADEVREAYRKMAFKWHPDLNRGTAEAGRRFQVVTEAFHEIKRIQATDEGNRARFGTHYGPASGPGQHTNYNYRRGSRSTFHGFRQRGTNAGRVRSGYAEEEAFRRWGGKVRHDNLHMIRSRLRMFESLGMGLGLFAAAAALSVGFVGTDVVWRTVNRGKSFEEVVEEMQGKAGQKTRVGRRMRRGGKTAEGKTAEGADDVSR